MNVAPPPRLVTTGIYAISQHPIYLGFCLICIGLSLTFASSPGLWVISPLVTLGCFALVWGYERQDLIARFGDAYHAYHPLLSIPAPSSSNDGKPTFSARIGVYLMVLLPWLALYELVARFPRGTESIPTYMPFEWNLPVLPWTEFIYGSTYLGTLAAPWIINRQTVLRRFAIEGLWGTFIGMWCFVVFPLVVPGRPFDIHAFVGRLLAFERTADPYTGNACPSFHGFWALLIASALATRSRTWAVIGWTWAVAVILSCMTTGIHSIADMVGGLALFLVVRNLPVIYHYLLRLCEYLANSYHFWRIGPIRVISHAPWSFFAGSLGALLIGLFAGKAHLPAMTLVAVCTLLGGMLWAQFIEGSPRLLRPFGYYGAILGGIIACIASPLVGTSPWLILAASAAAAPFIQAIGRIRCLVQGCCHGRPTVHTQHGLYVTNPSSRVCAMAHLDGVAIHPTQLYSVLFNIAIGGLFVRLYCAGATQTTITGLYLALAGLSRFVEESYRGEPQTRKWRGLPEYQWYAILLLIIGCTIMALPLSHPATTPEVSLSLTWFSPLLGLLTALVMSVDFPNSKTRFARLTG